MKYNRYLHPEQVPIQADKWSYVTSAQRSNISALEAAHLAHGIVAKMDSPLVFMDSNLYKVQELYTLLVDAAQNGKIRNAIIDNGCCKAPLLDWCMYLCAIDFPIPDLFLFAADEMLTERDAQDKEATVPAENSDTQLDINENDEKELRTSNSELSSSEDVDKPEESATESMNDSLTINTVSNREKLVEAIARPLKIFPKIPRKYFRCHPDITPLVPSSMTEKAFEDLVTEVSKKHKLLQCKLGCPQKDFLDAYETAHPELNEWFQKIREKRKKTSKIKS
jgi:hypothetical protein